MLTIIICQQVAANLNDSFGHCGTKKRKNKHKKKNFHRLDRVTQRKIALITQLTLTAAWMSHSPKSLYSVIKTHASLSLIRTGCN